MAVGEEYHRHFSSLKQLLSIHSESHPRQQDTERERERFRENCGKQGRQQGKEGEENHTQKENDIFFS